MKKLHVYLLVLISTISLYVHAQQSERMIAKTRYQAHLGAFVQADSTTYQYSTVRQIIDSTWSFGPAYDTSYIWAFRNGAYGNFMLQRRIQTWNIAEKPATNDLQVFDTATGLFHDALYQIDSYTVNNQPAGFVVLIGPNHNNYQRSEREYISNRPVKSVVLLWDTTGGGQWDSLETTTLTYNNNGQLISAYSLQQKQPLYSYLSTYTYDNHGRIDTVGTLRGLNGGHLTLRADS